jgi:hypothetical protein
MRSVTKPRAFLLALLTLLSCNALMAFPKGGGGHGQTLEPTTVLPLQEKLERDLAVHDGIVDAVTGPAKATFSVRVVKIEPDSVVVELHNLSDKTLKLSLYQVMKDGRYSPTSSCPLAPGARTYESWPEVFDALGFGAARELAAGETLACE